MTIQYIMDEVNSGPDDSLYPCNVEQPNEIRITVDQNLSIIYTI